MSSFNSADHPRGHPTNRGAFRDKEHTDPEVTFGLIVSPAIQELIGQLPPSEPWRSDPDRVARIALATLVSPGDAKLGSLIATAGPVAALRAWVDSPTSAMSSGWQGRVAKVIADTRRHGLGVVTPEDPSFPPQLLDLGSTSPLALWTKGDISILADVENVIQVTGARASTGYGEHVTTEISMAIAGKQKAIVNGGGYGIDGAALRAGLARSGARVAAVMAGGLDRFYPAGHEVLLARVTDSGVLVSEVPPGAPPTKSRFLARNRIAAALAGTTVIVEAGIRSGALFAAGHAHDLHRRVYAVPGPITSAASAGCHRLLQDKVAEILVDAADLVGSSDIHEES